MNVHFELNPFLTPIPIYKIKSSDNDSGDRMIFVPPPVITTYREFQDVNHDKNLQRRVSVYFLKEILKNLDRYRLLKPYQKHLDSKDGLRLIHHLLRRFVERGGTNWYDLRSPQYDLTMDYLYYSLNRYFAHK
jgi:hypothetical protein